MVGGRWGHVDEAYHDKEVQSFLGFVNFYQKFICDFSGVAHPLYALTHKMQ